MMLAVPLYEAVILMLPSGSVLVVRLALPPLRLIVPRIVVPAVKVTDPALGITDGLLTFAVNVTA